jgi:hypothetical protein
MAPSKRNPGAGVARVQKAVLLTTANASEITRPTLELQALYVSRRYAIPLAIAAAIASIAFDNGRRA